MKMNSNFVESKRDVMCRAVVLPRSFERVDVVFMEVIVECPMPFERFFHRVCQSV